MNYARGMSVFKPIQWNSTEIDLLDYFPLKRGNRWTADRPWGQEIAVMENTETINNVPVIQKAFYDPNISTEIATLHEYWSYDDEYIYRHGFNRLTSNGPEDQLGRHIISPPLRIKRAMPYGKAFASSGTMTYPDGTTVELSLTTKFTGIEGVSVTAGWFPECITVEETLTAGADVLEDYLVWLAKDVGEVKIYEDGAQIKNLVQADIPGAEGNISISYHYLQYRTYSNSTDNRVSGYLVMNKFGNTIDDADVQKIELKRSNGASIALTSDFSGRYGRFIGSYDSNMQQAMFTGPDYSTDYYLSFSDGIDFPSGYYTYEVTTVSGTVLRKSFFYPGHEETPIPLSATMRYEWKPDGALQLDWGNPDGAYDNVQVVLYDQVDKVVFYGFYPTDINQLVIPFEWTEKITNFHNPTLAKWRVRLQRFTGQEMNYARGISDIVEIPWNLMP